MSKKTNEKPELNNNNICRKAFLKNSGCAIAGSFLIGSALSGCDSGSDTRNDTEKPPDDLPLELSLDNVKVEDRAVVSACGIICAGCDKFTGESLEPTRMAIDVIDGMNIADSAIMYGLVKEDVITTVETLKKYLEVNEQLGKCPGCFNLIGNKYTACAVARCVRGKGYWTCAECEDYDPESEKPCSQLDENPDATTFTSPGKMSELIRRRYSSNTLDNLKRCREIGYPAFINEARDLVSEGWRTWQVISKDMVFSEIIETEK